MEVSFSYDYAVAGENPGGNAPDRATTGPSASRSFPVGRVIRERKQVSAVGRREATRRLKLCSASTSALDGERCPRDSRSFESEFVSQNNFPLVPRSASNSLPFITNDKCHIPGRNRLCFIRASAAAPERSHDRSICPFLFYSIGFGRKFRDYSHKSECNSIRCAEELQRAQ